MTMKALWGTLLIGFAVLNVHALAAGDGIAGFIDYLRDLGPWGVVAAADLLLALATGVYWMWHDARAKGVAPLPYAVLTAASGSVGLLVYLVRHGGSLRHQKQAGEEQANTRLEAA
jgi:hypothetical protein